MARASSCVSTLAAVSALAAASSFAQVNDREIKVTWQSNNVTQAQLSIQFGDLYESLDSLASRGYSPPIKKSNPIGGETVESVLRSENLVAGSFFPQEVDRYICHLNPRYCSDTGNGTKWTVSQGDSINLPDISFSPKIKSQPTNKSSRTSLESLVLPLKGCTAIDDQCRKLLVNLNAGDQSVLAQAFSGQMQVPALNFEANFSLTRQSTPGLASDAAAAVLTVNHWLVDRARASLPLPSASQASSAGRLESVNGAIASASAASSGASSIQLTFSTPASRVALLQAIDHPLSLGHRYIFESTPTIGLIDSWVYRHHCDIGPKVTFEKPEPAKQAASAADPPAQDAPPQCGVVRDHTDEDHGTHLLGLISSAPDSNVGPGVNPRASIFVVEMDATQLTDPQYNQQVAGQLDDLQNTEGAPQIFSMSFSYAFPFANADEKQLDPLGDFVDRTRRSLFIIAAGENLAHEIPLTRKCPLLLACTYSPRVLTVSAVSEPAKCDLFGSSNVGDGVDVVAPGRDITSTLAKNGVGVMSGTSQATAIVAGAASLLLSTDHTLAPEVVRNRLIYTSRLCGALRTYGGLLDLDRAMSYQSSYIQLKGDSAGRFGLPAVPGQTPILLEGSFVNSDLVAHFDEIDGQSNQGVRLRGLKRLRSLPDGSLVIFFHGGKPVYEKAPIQKMHALFNADAMKKLGPVAFHAKGGSVQFINMSDVVEYFGRIESEVEGIADGRISK